MSFDAQTHSNRGLRTGILLIGSLLAVVMIAWVTLGFASPLSDQKADGSIELGSEVRTLRVDSTIGKVEVIATDARRASIRYEVWGEEENVESFEPEVSQKPDSAAVTFEKNWGFRFADMQSYGRDPGGRVVVDVGRSVLSSVTITSDVHDVDVDANLNELSVRTTAGRVSARGEFRKVKVETKGGTQELALRKQASVVDLRSKSGDVTVRMAQEGYAIKVNSEQKTPEVSVRNASKSSHHLGVFSSSGNIWIRPLASDH